MGYIADNTTGLPPFSCHELYRWLFRVDPGFDRDDVAIDAIIRNEEPDIELWQYMGRRFMPPNPPRQWTRTPRVAADYSPPRYGAVRGRIAVVRVQYSFANEPLRDRVAARLTAERYSITDTWRSPVIV